MAALIHGFIGRHQTLAVAVGIFPVADTAVFKPAINDISDVVTLIAPIFAATVGSGGAGFAFRRIGIINLAGGSSPIRPAFAGGGNGGILPNQKMIILGVKEIAAASG